MAEVRLPLGFGLSEYLGRDGVEMAGGSMLAMMEDVALDARERSYVLLLFGGLMLSLQEQGEDIVKLESRPLKNRQRVVIRVD